LQRRISHGPPASQSELVAFETRYSVSLPQDLRAYFTTLNGSESGRNGPMDDQLLSFWHLSEIRSLVEHCPGVPIPHAESYFVFADYSIDVHEYVVRLSLDTRLPTPVMVVVDEFLVEVAHSFGAFLQSYLAGDNVVLFPDLPSEWYARNGRRQ
jgi:hypothetical protein